MNETEKHHIQLVRGEMGRKNKMMMRWLRRIVGVNRRTSKRVLYRRVRRQREREGV